MTETAPDDLSLLTVLAEAFSIGFGFDWDQETQTARGCDFELYEAFEASARTAWWFRLWTMFAISRALNVPSTHATLGRELLDAN